MKKINKTLFLFVALIGFQQLVVAQFQEQIKISKSSEINLSTYSGIISDQYTNGNPSLWKEMVNGKAEGLWLEWYPSGTLRYRAYWKNNLGNGKWEYFYPNGQLRSESFYIDDIAQGLYKSYYENGQLKDDMTFIDGKKEGIQFSYDADGIALSRKRYDNGNLVIDEPVIFEPNVISGSDSNEWGINFMSDGVTAYFTRRDNTTGQKRIYITTKTDNTWNTPSIAPFSTDEDEAPYISKDGNKLYFASYRPLPNGDLTQKMDMNIWLMKKINDGWSEPQPLSEIINKAMKENNIWPANYEAGPMTDENENLYFWTKGSKNNTTSIFMATLERNDTYAKPVELMPPSSISNYDSSPQLSPDGKVLFFTSDDRDDGYGGGDIYYSIKTGDQWTTPKNLGPIVNSYQSEGSPSFSPDGKYFYFSSNQGDNKDANGENIWNLYYMETKFLRIK